MKTYRPLRGYLQTLVICLLLALAIGLVEHTNLLLAFGVVLPLGLIYELPRLISNPRVSIDQKGAIAYKVARSTKLLDLNKLTNCTYKLKWGVRGSAIYIFHLYDSSGNYINLPANWWWSRHQLFTAIKRAVITNGIAIDPKTAKKLGVPATPRV